MKRLLQSALTLLMPLCLAAKSEWLDNVHDFGVFNEDLGQVETTFRLVNQGDKPMRILDARATCGCTTPSFNKGDIAPGDTALLHVAYSATGRPGQFEKYVYVRTSDNPSQQRTLTLRGTVIGATATIRSRFPVNAGRLQLQTSTAGFGSVKKGKLKSLFINIYNQSPDTLQPLIEGLPKAIVWKCHPEELQPGQQGQLSLVLSSFDDNIDYGINDGKFQLIAAPADTITMDYFALIEEDFDGLTPGQRLNGPIAHFTTARADLGLIDTPQEVQLQLENRGKAPLLIRRLQCFDPAVTLCKISSTKIKPGKTAKINVKIDPALATSDFINARITIITNDPDNHVLAGRVTAEK